MKLISSQKENCTLCYACIRVCPARAIKIDDSHAQVIDDRCIGCGHCVSVCAPDALRYASNIDRTNHLIENNDKVVAICDTSIAGEFADISSRRNFVGMIKALGFDFVCESAFGADLVGLKYKELISNFKGRYYIVANCPSVYLNVEKFHPDSIKNLAPIVSPMVAMTKVVREKYGKDTKVVYIGPCTAAKIEAEETKGDAKVDAVLTFVELRKMFRANNISENAVEYENFDPPLGGRGALYPLSGGLCQAVGMNEDLLNGRMIITEGRFNFLESIKEFEHIQSIKKHIDLFYCDGGCIMGPGMTAGGKKFERRSLVIDYVRRRLEEQDENEWQKNIDKYSKLDLSRAYHVNDQRTVEPTEIEVDQVLKDLGKQHHKEMTGCAACGYESCKEFAKAVGQGLAKPDMCITYDIKNKKDYLKTMKLTNEKLEKTRLALEKSEKLAQEERRTIKEMTKTTNLMLQNIPSGVVIVDKKLKIVNSNSRFIHLLGEDAEAINDVIPGLKGADLKTLLPSNIINLFNYGLTNEKGIENKDITIDDKLLNITIFPIKKDEVVGAVIKDMYQPDIQREEVMNRVTEVIDKNLKMVQNIGFLLGEGASETEHMLNSIIKSYKSDKE